MSAASPWSLPTTAIFDIDHVTNNRANHSMKILVIGGGGREHALAWKLAQSTRISKVLVAPGNAGTAIEDGLGNVNIADHGQLIELARREEVALTVVGPEAPLAAGVV